MNSFTEENYLKTIFKLLEKGVSEVSTNAIAERVNTKASSVTDMLKKLSDKKLINYQKYQGVSLTRQGKKIALNIIRKHRLWEVLLVEKLNFKWDEVHDIAEQLEHVNSEELVSRLDKFLNYPRFDPHGDPIPDIKGNFQHQESQPLSRFKKNNICVMMGVIDHSSSFLQYLDKMDILLGHEIQIKEITSYDKSFYISINKKKNIYISNQIAQNILVSLSR